MPNRIIREGWLESERINHLDAPEERFFLRLCLRADDFGRYTANPILLKSNLFPLRDDVRSTDIPRWLAACETAGLVRCYEVDGKRYVEIPRFEQRTRAQRSKFPAPVGPAQPDVRPLSVICQTDDRHPRTEPETEAETNSERGAAPPSVEPEEPAAPRGDGELPLGPLATDPATDPVAMTFPTVGTLAEWPLRESKVDEWKAAYPAVEVDGALRELRQWCIDNPTRRKTANGMTRFLSSRLAVRQNRSSTGQGPRDGGRKAAFA